MPGRECYHCKQLVAEGQPHDCWTTTEAALTRDLPEDLQDAWERLRETAVSFGEQRIYASHHSIMFSRKACYFFVRPKRTVLEVCVFLGRPVNAPQVRRVHQASRTKTAHLLHIRHRDEVESPITDWLQEAYEWSIAATPSARSEPAEPSGSRAPEVTPARVTKRPLRLRAAAKPAKGGRPAPTRGAGQATETPASNRAPTRRAAKPPARRSGAGRPSRGR